MEAFTAPASVFLLVIMAVLAALNHYTKKRKLIKETGVSVSSGDAEEQKLLLAPGPKPLPFIGNLHHLAKFAEDPYKGFCELGKTYGPFYKLSLGSTPAYVVNDFDQMKEVLIKKGHHFDGRPNFNRWNLYFDGDRQKCKYNQIFLASLDGFYNKSAYPEITILIQLI